ncbi:adenylate cyclase [Tistlia consotensis]|uniref:Adenylate cyclase n=1 Tax=Tistlia consotensis USBA 355 TaxID=560819 RepID=A0A1Y6CGM3_9PROT|nr:adenylate/guanylate cyclase domain-containing protein [Tistlia consotensis]SMF52122.1 adenylate cyclase [Tistlia consotensis USBA 355]SNR83327.1 adenylate cyclase [Tistlia consotensis]
MTGSAVQRLRLLALMVALSAAAGAGYALAERSSGTGWVVEAASGATIGTVISSFIVGIGLFGEGRLLGRSRRLPFVVAVLLRTLVYGVAIMAALVVVPWLYFGVPLLPLRPGIAGDLAFSFAVTFVGVSLLSIAQLIGPGVLANLLTGRYYRPREEQRIVLFLDLVGSTTIAERIGNVRFHALLSETFTLLSKVVMDQGGEVHRYVGDALIATWPLGTPARNARPLLCLLACRDALDAAGPGLLRRHGHQPAFRAGLHAGPVVAGEIGGFKREIALLGDTMNTAARIEEACRTAGHPLLVSGTLAGRAEIPAGLRLTSIGPALLRGKSAGLELFALERAEAGSDERGGTPVGGTR